MFNPQLSEKLEGAQIIARKRIGDTWLWCCYKPFGVQKYVTWMSGHNSSDCPEWGHYFDSLDRAYGDFIKRCNKQRGLV